MKRWMSILLGVGGMAGAALIPAYIQNPDLQKASMLLFTAGMAALINKTSVTNPDGTSAKAPWIEPREKR